jgi:1-acyl-sn-glycerol-3-phosphate acyltransferase
MPLHLNLLHEQIAEQRQRQRDPLKLGMMALSAVGALMLLFYMFKAYKTLETKNRLVWFPEGRRSPTGEITDFLPGIALVLERTGAKAVPVHISGSYEAWPRSRKLPGPHKVTIRFGTPLSADDLAARGEGANQHTRIARALQDAVIEIGENASA